MSSYWTRASSREKRLAAIAIAVAAGVLCYVIALRAFAYFEELDAQIAEREQDLLFYTKLSRQEPEIQRRFNEIASEHSSEWTEQQIYDRLRQEIYRFSLKDPEQGESSTNQPLLRILSLPAGRLNETGEGYREYQIAFRTEPALIQQVSLFLQRLQEDGQALRVDNLELSRNPTEQAVSASFLVTRLVIDSSSSDAGKDLPVLQAETGDNLIANSGFESWDSAGLQPESWLSAGCAMVKKTDVVTEGVAALQARAQAENARIWQTHLLKAGAAYTLLLDASVSGKAHIVVTDETGAWSTSPVALEPDGAFHRYEMRLTTPPGGGAAVQLLAPVVVLETTDTLLVLDNLTLSEVEE